MAIRRRTLARQVLGFSPIRASARDDMPSVLNRVQDNLAQLLNTLSKAVAELQDAPAPSGGPPLSDDNPQALGTTAPGTSTDASRADHVHALPDATEIPNFTTEAAAAAPVQSVNGMTGAVVVPSGGLTYFAESEHTAAPNATVPANRLIPAGSATSIDFVVAPKGNGAIVAAVPDSTATGGNKRGILAVDLQRGSRGAATQVASGVAAVIAGGTSNTASGGNSTVGGGSNNSATQNYATVSGGNNNTATQAYAAVGGGNSNSASGQSATVAGGNNNTATQTTATVGGGGSNSASGTDATVAGGSNNTADGANSAIPGGLGGRTRAVMGKLAFASATTAGAEQTSTHVTRMITTNATPATLTAQSVAASAAQVNTLPNNSVYAVRVQVTAREAATGDVAAWEVTGVVKRGANAASTAVVGTPAVTLLAADAGAATWACALVANTTYGSAVIEVTGEVDKTIRWCATMHTTELA